MAERLKKYNSKRNFDKTAEPRGRVKRSNPQSLKFSVQHHMARADHYDLRLELKGVALSWAVPKGPSFCTEDKRLAVRVEDHPLDYMDFEGTIPKGEYGGGTVMLWDEGIWTPRSDPEKGLKEGSLKFFLDGKRLKGDWALVRMNKEGDSEPWLLIKERDGFAKSTAGISRFTRGVRSGKSMTEIARSCGTNPFEKAEVMLAEPCEELPSGREWIYELKYDGHRVVGFSQKGKTKLFSRNGRDCTKTFLPAAEGLSELLKGRAAVVDGEMTVAGEGGIPDFGALQAYVKRGRAGGLNYVLFDLLALDGEDLRNLPLAERKKKLKELLKGGNEVLSYSEHTSPMTRTALETLREKGIEGVVAKNKNSTYSAGRNGEWKKLKFRKGEEFVIGGYTISENGGLRSLLVGVYVGGKLKFSGRVGTGFKEKDKAELLNKFSKIRRKTSPFNSLPEEYKRNAVFVQPKFIAQTEFAEITSAGLLRQASFKGLRQDKSPKEVEAEDLLLSEKAATKAKPQQKSTEKASSGKAEKPKTKAPLSRKQESGKVAGVTVTHPEKVMFSNPVLTKGQLVNYYAAVAEKMFPYLKDRFLSLVCCPSGTDGEKFFRRHFEGDFAGIKSAPAEEEEYFYITNEKALVFLAQYNAVEIHVWASKKSSPYRPDVMVFDLDPDENLPLKEVRRGVLDLKEVLDGLGLKSFLKTSGGKGYHVVVPFKKGADGQVFRDFSKRVAELLESKFPNRYTSTIAKKARTGKIFIDWQRNSPGATSVAPYSVRARKGAPVSMPISWEELSKVAPASVTVRTAIKRLENDPWADFNVVKASQSLTESKIKK